MLFVSTALNGIDIAVEGMSRLKYETDRLRIIRDNLIRDAKSNGVKTSELIERSRLSRQQITTITGKPSEVELPDLGYGRTTE